MPYALWNQLVVLTAKARERLLEGALVGVVNAKRHRANWEIKHICHVFICTYNSHMNFEIKLLRVQSVSKNVMFRSTYIEMTMSVIR